MMFSEIQFGIILCYLNLDQKINLTMSINRYWIHFTWCLAILVIIIFVQKYIFKEFIKNTKICLYYNYMDNNILKFDHFLLI